MLLDKVNQMQFIVIQEFGEFDGLEIGECQGCGWPDSVDLLFLQPSKQSGISALFDP